MTGEEKPMPATLLMLRHPGIAPIPPAAAVSALTAEQLKLHREDSEIDTRPLDAQVSQGDWGGQGALLAEQAGAIRDKLAALGNAEIHYCGIAEIPHVIALGSLLGDEVPIVPHEYDRDAASWAWPTEDKTLDARVIGAPEGAVIPAPGSVVLRIAISAPVSDKDVGEAVGNEHLADITVTLAEGLTPGICKVRSARDLQAIRDKIRESLAAIRARFPNLSALHVFAAAPISVCFALGQELKPRNSPPIQTYRYRKVEGQSAYTPAIELSSELEARAESVLSGEDLEVANDVRSLWREAVSEVEQYARGLSAESQEAKWFESLAGIPPIRSVRPYPSLPHLSRLMPSAATVDATSFRDDYELATPENVWRVNDHLLLGFLNSTERRREDTKRLIKIFLLHEYLHVHHSLTAYRSLGIGAFPNCLEHADYVADAYALFHELDMSTASLGLDTDEKQRMHLVAQLERVVKSFWAFEQVLPVREWQVRRFRRYLNWYWRYTQVRRAPNLTTAIRLLDHPPHVELAGLSQFARGQRVFCRTDRPDVRTRPEFAVVLENEKLLRVPDSPTSNLKELCVAFQERNHEAIVRFFKAIYERAEELGGSLPVG